MKLYKTLQLFTALLLISTSAFAGKIQNEGVKSLAEITAANGTITGNLTLSTNCISSPSSLSGLIIGQYVYDTSNPTYIPALTTIAGLPGTCSAGQIQMSASSTHAATGDTITFGGQVNNLINTSKIYEAITNQQLSAAFSTSIVGTLLGETKVNQASDITGTTPVANGGTGLATLTAHAIYAGNTTAAPTPISPGASGNILQSNGTDFVSAANVGSTNSYAISNVGFATSVASNALTIALKQADGSTDCTSGTPCAIDFRSSTASSGAFNQRQITSSLSMVIPSGTTIGTVSGNAEYIYVYAIDNSGTVELASSLSAEFDSGTILTTTATSGGTSRATLYSTTARSNVPSRLIGRIKITEATAGTWVTNSAEISTQPFFNISPQIEIYVNGTPTSGTLPTKVYSYPTTQVNNGGPYITYSRDTVNGDTFTVNIGGNYFVGVGGGGSDQQGITINDSSLNTSITSTTYAQGFRLDGGSNGTSTGGVLNLKNGDVMRCKSDLGGTIGTGTQYCQIRRVGNL